LALSQPAAWYSEPKATPTSRYFAINHKQDKQGCDFGQELQNVYALGMDIGAPIVSVDEEAPPYGHSRVLFTNYPGTQVDSKAAHGTAISDKNQAIFRQVWTYMLTTPTDLGI
jgi:hypothetical protein